MRRTTRLAVTAGLGLAYGLLLVAALVPLPILFLVAAVAVVLTELWLSRQAPYLLPELLRTQLGTRFRLLSLDVLTAILAARLLPDAAPVVALAVAAVLLLATGRDVAGVFARRVEWRRAGGPVSWRGLVVQGLPEPRTARRTAEPDLILSLLTLLIPLGYAIGSLHDRFGTAIAAQWIVIGVVVLLLAGRAFQYVVLNRVSRDAVRLAVQQGIAAHAPEVVLHHSGRRGTVEQVLLWVPALLALDRPCLIVVREPTHLDALEGCGVPVVWAPRSQDVEQFMVASVELALYPSNATNINNHLLRVPGIYDVLVGHGESDEAENRSPLGRMYDQIWVAGPAGRARYAYPASGVSEARIKQIGPVRPATAPAGRLPSSGRPVAVYAPTWENVVESVDVSSLVSRGEAVLEALLARQDVRVVFAPAAPTGSRLPEAAAALERLTERVAAAGADHRTVPAAELPTVLASAAFAVVDVSPVLAEAVRADVPFAVPAVPGMSVAEMRAAFPSTTAGAVLDDFPRDVFAALDDALGADSRAAARLALGRELDGAGDFPTRFRSAVDEAIAAQHRRRAFERPSLTA
jgi:hypothetical protein